SHKGCAELVASFFSRPGRNPGTGVPCEITACRVVTFKARPKLRQRCNPHVQDAEA
ncbi:restriction endonuclease subunit S, partial [Acidithiobacillus ferridurans]|nr:restriction endonuclease subunit S [Acidithiobacillus ferridurans]